MWIAAPSGVEVQRTVGGNACYLGTGQAPAERGPHIEMGNTTVTLSSDISCGSSIHGITCIDDTDLTPANGATA